MCLSGQRLNIKFKEEKGKKTLVRLVKMRQVLTHLMLTLKRGEIFAMLSVFRCLALAIRS